MWKIAEIIVLSDFTNPVTYYLLRRKGSATSKSVEGAQPSPSDSGFSFIMIIIIMFLYSKDPRQRYMRRIIVFTSWKLITITQFSKCLDYILLHSCTHIFVKYRFKKLKLSYVFQIIEKIIHTFISPFGKKFLVAFFCNVYQPDLMDVHFLYLDDFET